MEYNPDALEDKPQVVYSDAQTTVTRQPLPAGTAGSGVYTGTRNDEKDFEAQTPMYDSTNPATTTTTAMMPTTTTTTTTRQTVRPSPTHNTVPNKVTIVSQQPRSGGGFLGTFATRTKGRFFFPLHAAIVFFSFLVLVSSAIIEDRAPALGNQRFVQYSLVVAQISFAVSLGACVMERLGLLENNHIRIALSAFQVFFWVPALVIMTFFGVFVSPVVSANGFFGAWGALTAASIAFSHETERTPYRDANGRANTAAPRTSLLLLFFTSLMIMGSGIRIYSAQSGTPGGFDAADAFPWTYTVFSVAFGAITAFLSVVFLIVLDMTPPKTMLGFGSFLWLWVAAGTLVLTFGDPFEQATGNGYYACLFALLASFGLLVSLRLPERRSAGAPNTNANTNTADGTTTTTTANARRRNRESDTSATFFLFVRGGTFSSLVVLIAACLTCTETGGCQGNIQRFQVAAGAVSLFIGLVVVILEAFGLYKVHAAVKIAFSVFWLLWWVACFVVLTYFGSFQSPTLTLSFFANGFFFTWAALVFAALAFAESLKELGRNSDPPSPLTAKSGFLLLIIIGSAIELGAAIKWWYDTNSSNLSRYALTLGPVSIGLVLILFVILLVTRKNFEAHDSLYNAGLYLLTVWWAVGALVLTYQGFWTSAIDNGYFSVFFTLGACLLALSGMWRTDDDDMDDTTTGATSARAYQ